jgi:glycosidase
MGENLAVDDRLAVRTPMQWTSGPTAGFSTAPADALCRPLPTETPFSPSMVNVRDQRTDPDSLLNWFERLIRLRKELPEIGWGLCTVLDAGAASVLALRFDWEERKLVTLHNLAKRAVTVTVPIDDARLLVDLVHHGKPVKVRDGAVGVRLAAHDHRWLRLTE